MKHFAFTILLTLTGGLAGAQNGALTSQPAHIDAQRARISEEHSRLEAGFLVEDAGCYKRFAVNSCLNDVNVRRRAAMADLRRQEIFLNDEERRIKGEDHIRKTQEKSSPENQQEAVDRRAKAAEDYQGRLNREKDQQQERATLKSNEKGARKANAEKLLRQQKIPQVQADKLAAAAQEAQKFSQRQKKAQERRAAHEAEQLKRLEPAAKPLPLPE